FVLLLVQLAFLEVGLRLCEVPLRLVEVRLILARVELIEELTGLHARPVTVGLGEEIALDLGADLRVDVPVGGPDPFPQDRARLLDPLGALDGRRLRRRGGGLGAARDPERGGEGERSGRPAPSRGPRGRRYRRRRVEPAHLMNLPAKVR